MNRRLKRNVALGAVGVMALAGGGAAYAATSAPDGKLTQKQADEMKQHAPPVGGPPPGGAEFRFRGGPPPGGAGGMVMRGPIGPGFDAAAEYLGLTQAQLRARLAKGASLADVAKAEGKSVDGLQQAMLDAAKRELDKAVADGDLTQKQADEMLKHLTDDVDQIVQGKGPGGLGGPCGPGGPGGPGGPHFD